MQRFHDPTLIMTYSHNIKVLLMSGSIYIEVVIMELYFFLRTSVHSPRETTNDFYHNNRHLPMFSRRSSRFDTQEIFMVICICCQSRKSWACLLFSGTI